MTQNVIIRQADAQDAKALAALKLICFRETFLEDLAVPYPPDDLTRFEVDSYGFTAVAAELANPSHRQWVVENAAGVLVGYAHAGPCKLPHPDATAAQGELFQLYVRRAHQGRRLGRKVLNLAFEWLGLRYPGPIWLGVWSGNHRAQAVYMKLGFLKVGDYHFMVGDHRDDEYIFRRDQNVMASLAAASDQPKS